MLVENLIVALCAGTTALVALIYASVRASRPALLNPRTPWMVLASVGALLLEALGRLGVVPLPPHVMPVVLALLTLRHLIAFARGFLRATRPETDLEEQVREKALQLRRAQTDLVRAEKLASVGLIAAGVAHEINNPTAYALANLRLLEDALETLRAHRAAAPRRAAGSAGAPPTPAEAQDAERLADEALRDALEGIFRIRDIVAGLKSLSQQDARVPEAVRLSKVIETSVGLARPAVRLAATVTLALDRSCFVLGHTGQLSQVIINLVVNAAEAMPEEPTRPGTIEVRTLAVEGEIALEVRDNGRGIPAAELGEVFRPLYTTKATGTGLGLAISRRIVEEHGGRIEVESIVGEGTTFRVVLPQHAAPEAAEPTTDTRPAAPPLTDSPPVPVAALPPAAEAAPTASAPRKLVLLIDDEAFLLKILARFIGRHHRVTTASSADDALRLVRDGASPDLVLCDLVMPGKSGADFYLALRRERPDLADRVTFMSGGGTDEKLHDFASKVGRPRLQKPLEPDALLVYLDAQLAPPSSD